MSTPTTSATERRADVPIILASLFVGVAIGVSASGFRLMAHSVPYENRIDAMQRDGLNTALLPFREKSAAEQLATGIVTLPTPHGAVTLHCAALADGTRECDNGKRYSEEAFKKAVRADSDARIDRQFADAYSDQIRVTK